MTVGISLILAVLLILGNAFFVGAEFGLIAARRSSIELLAQSGSKSARITLAAMERVSLMLAGAQLGVTLCSLALGAVGEPVIAHILEVPLHDAGMPAYLLHPVSFVAALTIMVYLHVVIGEMVPKNLALSSPDKTALLLIPWLVRVVRVISPVVTGLNHTANLCLRLLGIEPKGEVASTFTSDEVAGFIEESRREGLISEDEGVLLSGALRFDERTVRTVLLPTASLMVVALKEATPAAIERLSASTGFSRFPVKRTDGTLVGYVHLKDTLSVQGADRELPIARKDLRQLITIRSSSTLRGALTAMQRTGSHLAQVVNGKGEPVGIVTLEDVLEELVGEIRGEIRTPKQALTRDA